MAPYDLTKEALNDLRNIFWYGVMSFGEHRANEYYDTLLEKFDEIASTPYLFQSVEDMRAGYRRCVCGVNSIYYRIVDGKVEIVRVIGRQDMTALPD